MKPLVSDLSSLNRGFGIEVEMVLPSQTNRERVQQTLASILTVNGLPAVARHYQQTALPPGAVLGVEFDITIGAPPVVVEGRQISGISYAQIEMKTKVMRSVEEFESIVPLALGICRALGGRASGGLHVHVGVDEVRDDPSRIRSLYNLLHRFEKVLFALHPPHRIANEYSKPLRDSPRLLHRCRSLRSYRRALEQFDRFYATNFVNLWEPRPHIEFRHASSSLNPANVSGWTYTCLQLVEHATKRNCQASQSNIVNDRKGLEKMLITCGFKSCTGIYEKVADPRIVATRKWLIKRWKRFFNQRNSRW